MSRRLAFIMAGGSGERFWPVSTRENPKQFLNLASPDQTLLEQSVDRAADIVGIENVYVATGKHLADKSAEGCPKLKSGNVWAEPAKKNTTGCLIWVAANLIAQNPDDWATISVAVLTADQRIQPESEFVKTVNLALQTAEDHGSLVTIGIRPDRPETGFGYIEVGEQVGSAHKVAQFKEKPDIDLAQHYLEHGGYLWNSGMFFYTLATFMAELEKARPTMASITRTIAGCLAQNDATGAEAAFNELESLSIDYALAEKSDRVMVVEATFEWDDLGAWDSIARSYPADPFGNVNLGKTRAVESTHNVVYNPDSSTEVCLLGVENLVVVVSNGTVLVCPKDRAQEVKKFLQ